jgi:hypothetical protein
LVGGTLGRSLILPAPPFAKLKVRALSADQAKKISALTPSGLSRCHAM